MHRGAPVIGLAIFAVALWVLRHQLATLRYQDIGQLVGAVPTRRIAIALGLTALSFVALMGYDAIAGRFVKNALGFGKVALTSFVAFAFSQSLGFALLTGGGIRYRLYSAWGLSAVEIANIIAFSSATFWLGVLTVGSSVMLLAPTDAELVIPLSAGVLRVVGVVLAALVVGYLTVCVTRRRPLRLLGWDLTLPPPKFALAQIGLGILDWTMAAAVLYALLPPGSAPAYPLFLGIFLLAHTAGVVSHVPGGLGVFESIVLVALQSDVPTESIVASLVIYRAVYYLLPFSVAVILFAGYELAQRKVSLTRFAETTGRWVPIIAPRILAGAVFLGGVVLLVSGATPAVGTRLTWINGIVPLGVIELSHFLGSVLGVGLLVLAWGLYRRIDAAYHLAIAFLSAGMLLSLLKGFDYEEALTLAVMLAAVVPARKHFHRKASLLSEPFTPGWVMAVGTVVVAFVWLGLFAFKHVEFDSELWWRLALSGNAPRFVRASVGVVVALGVFAVLRLLRPAQAEPTLPTEPELASAAQVVTGSSRASSNLALVGDKALLFNDDKTAFIMYDVAGRSWVALGDPVGPAELHEALVWRFRELVDRHDGRTVFYQVQPDRLPLYLELGLDPLQLGEEAKVPLTTFGLEGGARRGLRRAHRQVEKDGCSFSLVMPPEVPNLLPELGRISNTWLEQKNTREKGFSLGRFDPKYVCRFPIALVRRGDRVVAFANCWTTGDRSELSIDLMRYAEDAPDSVMDYLFTELMLWGRQAGYRYFGLGMAPLSGLENRDLAPLWNKLSDLAFRHGEHFYNFQGLRQYKEKFDPEWTPRYLVSPGGLALPMVLADIARLISGGFRGLVGK